MIDNDLLSPFGGTDKLSLHNILNIDDRRDDDNEMEVIHQSHYFVHEHLIKCQQNNHNSFLIFSLNYQSLNAKFDETKIQIETFRKNGCEISAFCLQEILLGEDYDTSLLQIAGYTLISEGKLCSAHACLVIYLNNTYKCKNVKVFEDTNIWEGQFLEIPYQTMTKTIILGNVYRPPKDINENYQTFIDEFANKLEYLNNNGNEVIMGFRHLVSARCRSRRWDRTYYRSSICHYSELCIQVNVDELDVGVTWLRIVVPRQVECRIDE